MSIADKLTRIAINEKLVHDAGYKKALKELCPVFAQSGTIVQFVPAVGSKVEYELQWGGGMCNGIVVCGKNLYDATNYPMTPYKMIRHASGSEATSSAFSATLDFIPCEHLRGKEISIRYAPIITSPTGSTAGIAFYDEGKNYLNGSVFATAIVPEDAVYMRFSINKNYVDEAQIELGNVVTDYEEYSGREVRLSAEEDTSWEFEAKERKTFTVYTFRDNAGDSGSFLSNVRVEGLEDPVSVINKLKQQQQVATEG